MLRMSRKLSRREFLRMSLLAFVVRLPLVLYWQAWHLDSGEQLDAGLVLG